MSISTAISHPCKSIAARLDTAREKFYRRKYRKYRYGSEELNALIDNDRKTAIDVMWWKTYHKRFPWKHPVTLDEKISYLSGISDTSLWTKYADKYEVRKYVQDCGLGHILTDCYGVWERAEDIDFDALPSSFALKCTHDCGSTILIRDKRADLDIPKVTQFLGDCLARQYGYETVEPHYTKIKPRVMAEELIPMGEGRRSATDYKIWCVNGRAEFIVVFNDRVLVSEGESSVRRDIYSPEWQPMRQVLDLPSQEVMEDSCPKPDNLCEMVQAAERLSQGFPVVRMDLYSVAGKTYFGEMTFTPRGGRQHDFTYEFQKLIGDKIKV